MDHAPGQRQFARIEHYRHYYQRKLKLSDEDFASFVERRSAESAAHSGRQRAAIGAYARDHGIVLASHDDATLEHVEEAVSQGIRVAEFPTTIEAARASHAAGMAVLMGAPNVVRGGSHSGNVSARALAEEGLLDIMSSDYIPFSLIQAAFGLEGLVEGISLPHAVGLVTRNPAVATGLTDRGEIVPGKRADLVRVGVFEVPIVRSVWREGRRVL
jgi:alpha-D-ribose 1-methylphosphonate 5-triphosphate diphosphatase